MVDEFEFDPYQELVKEQSPLLFCDVCMYYPIEPVHGHFMCPACRNITKCCEGIPLEAAASPAANAAAHASAVTVPAGRAIPQEAADV